MSIHTQTQEAPRILGDPGTLAALLRAMGLQVSQHPEGGRARLIRARRGSAPVAAILEQSDTFRDDKRAILALKEFARELPIIFIARSVQPRREMAIRRLCIHYFLAHPAGSEELRLVLEALLRASAPTLSYERFFTR